MIKFVPADVMNGNKNYYGKQMCCWHLQTVFQNPDSSMLQNGSVIRQLVCFRLVLCSVYFYKSFLRRKKTKQKCYEKSLFTILFSTTINMEQWKHFRYRCKMCHFTKNITINLSRVLLLSAVFEFSSKDVLLLHLSTDRMRCWHIEPSVN